MRKKEVLDLLQRKPYRAKREGGKTARMDRPYPAGALPDSLHVAEPPAPYGASASVLRPPATLVAAEPFEISFVENLAGRLGVRGDDLLQLIGLAGRTAQRRWQEGKLTVDESDRLYRVARLFHRAIEVLESQEGASRWLKRPQALFAGAAPLALLGSDAGAKAVEDQLGRIDHGIFA